MARLADTEATIWALRSENLMLRQALIGLDSHVRAAEKLSQEQINHTIAARRLFDETTSLVFKGVDSE